MQTNHRYAELARRVNEAKTQEEHDSRLEYLQAWRSGVTDAGKFISDYIANEANRDHDARPIKAGIWLDWKPGE